LTSLISPSSFFYSLSFLWAVPFFDPPSVPLSDASPPPIFAYSGELRIRLFPPECPPPLCETTPPRLEVAHPFPLVCQISKNSGTLTRYYLEIGSFEPTPLQSFPEHKPCFPPPRRGIVMCFCFVKVLHSHPLFDSHPKGPKIWPPRAPASVFPDRHPLPRPTNFSQVRRAFFPTPKPLFVLLVTRCSASAPSDRRVVSTAHF